MLIKSFIIKIINIILILFFGVIIYAQENNLINLGIQEEQRANYGLALDYYKKALEDDNKPFLYVKIGKIYEENIRDNEKALDIYKKGLEQFPMNFNLNEATMRLLLINNQIDEGINKYIFLSKIKKNNDRFMFPSYFLYRYKNEISDADFLSFCQKYIKMNPSDFVLREYLANEYFNKGDFLNAINELEILIKEKDSYYLQSGFFSLGICYYKIKKYDIALEYFQEAIRTDGNMPNKLIQDYIDVIINLKKSVIENKQSKTN